MRKITVILALFILMVTIGTTVVVADNDGNNGDITCKSLCSIVAEDHPELYASCMEECLKGNEPVDIHLDSFEEELVDSLLFL